MFKTKAGIEREITARGKWDPPGLISDQELERREQNLIDRNTPLTDEEKTRARELEIRGLDRDAIALKLGWTMARLILALRQKRDCLRCGREFTSDGIFERICTACRQTNARVVGVMPTAECDFVPRSNPGRGRKDG